MRWIGPRNSQGLLAFVAFGLTMFFMPESADARGHSWSVRLGAQFDFKPQDEVAFAIGTENHYKIAGPMYFAFGGRVQVNGDYFGWTLEPGLLAKVDLDSIKPTFRAMFMIGSKHFFDYWDDFPFYLGASFGPGLMYDFEEAAVGLEISFDVAKYVRHFKHEAKETEAQKDRPNYFSLLTAVVLEF